MPTNISSLIQFVNKPAALTNTRPINRLVYMRYGQRLSYARKVLRGWTQPQLAERANVSQGLISQLETSQTATGSQYTVRLPARPNAEGRMICPACGTRGEPKTITRGSLRIEILLWLLLIVPGVIYSLWRLTTRAEGCPACGQIGMIPVATPRGQQLLDGHK